MPKGVVFLPSYYEAIRELPDADRLQLYDCIIRYGLYEEVMELPVALRGYFALIRPTMDLSTRRYESAVDNGRKGGRPRKNQRQNQRQNQTQNQTRNQTRNQEKEYEKEYDSEKEIEKERDTKGAPSHEQVYRLAEESFEKKRAEALFRLDTYGLGR